MHWTHTTIGCVFNNITILKKRFPHNVEKSIQCLKQTTVCLFYLVLPDDSALECTETRRTEI
jgi:hypothetical protein